MSEETLFPRDVVQEVFFELFHRFDPQPAWGFGVGAAHPVTCPNALCDRICGVGGFRRGKKEMKDLELLYIPHIAAAPDPADLFGAPRETNVTEALIEQLVTEGVIAPRLAVNGNRTWGPKNKHARHVGTGLPLDLFAANAENWFNRLVVTTGPKSLNIQIAQAARAKSWEWEVYDAGFVPMGATWETAPSARLTMRSEKAVFEFVDLPFLKPEDRR